MWEAVQFLYPCFIASLAIIAILGYLGTHVLEREIIFIDISLAQISAVGSVLAFVLFRQHSHEAQSSSDQILALGFTILAAAFFSFVAHKVTQISQATVIGVSYAIAAAASLFLLALAAGSDIHMEEMLTGSLLWTQWADIIKYSGVFCAVGIFHYIFRHKFIALSKNYKDVKALQNLDLEIKEDLIVGFLGVNGAGKTTTIKLLNNLI